MAEAPYIIPSEAVASSTIGRLGFDSERRILAVEFKSGEVFHYADVPVGLAAELYVAESKGRFYAERIRGKFSGQKMTGRCAKCGDGPGRIGLTCDTCGTANYVDTRKPKAAEL